MATQARPGAFVGEGMHARAEILRTYGVAHRIRKCQPRRSSTPEGQGSDQEVLDGQDRGGPRLDILPRVDETTG
jgi:hypothetical protein